MLRIAHRGASGYCPENTLVSFSKAVEMGASAIEFDVQLTEDNQLIVMHDYALERTANGQGLVMDANYDYIRSLDAGSSFSETYKGEQVPSLDEVLKLVPKDIILNIEIKKIGLDTRNIVPRILEVVKKNHRELNTIYSSFDHTVLQELSNNGLTSNGLLLNSSMIKPWDYIKAHNLGCKSINIAKNFVNKQFVEEAHKNGFTVNVYTVNTPEFAAILESFSVDAIFTNYMDIV